jgi:hypothetical protein
MLENHIQPTGLANSPLLTNLSDQETKQFFHEFAGCDLKPAWGNTAWTQTQIEAVLANNVDEGEKDVKEDAKEDAKDLLTAVCLARLKAQFEALARVDSRAYTWEQILAAIPNMAEFLAGVDSLCEPEIYWIKKNGQLVIGDGSSKPAPETLGLNYHDSKMAAESIPNRGLITLGEYKRKNKGQFDQANQFQSTYFIWVASKEESPSSTKIAAWNGDEITTFERSAYEFKDSRVVGSRRVLRIQLNLEL